MKAISPTAAVISAIMMVLQQVQSSGWRSVMTSAVDSSFVVFALSLFLLWFATRIGAFFHKRLPALEEHERQDLELVIGATLTLLGLIIGFSFSMVISRYDQRKNYEEAEANAIGTEYLRVGLLPTEETKKARELLRRYLDQRVLFYETHDLHQLHEIDSQTASLQSQLWNLVESRAGNEPTAPVALVLSGMNEVLNSQGYTQAAWWNRLPIA